MTYTVKEIFYTLQGEGAQSGREEDRSRAVCQFCDTDFVGTGPDGGRFASAIELAEAVDRCWAGRGGGKYIVCTGGEPLLQLDEKLIDALHEREFEVAVETNGTKPAPASLDWICVSPKAGAPFVQTSGSELKLVYPQENAPPEQFAQLDFEHFFLQPMDGSDTALNTERAIEYCLAHPKWRLSIQAHKLVGLR